MKGLLPESFKFISVDNENFDVRLFDDVEAVFIEPSYLSHSIYYKVINEVRKRGVKLVYLTGINENKVLYEIANGLAK